MLDLDATDDAVHGRQEGHFFHGYYDHYCFLPFYVFAGDHLLIACLRPVDIGPAKHAGAILKLRVAPDALDQERHKRLLVLERGLADHCRAPLVRAQDVLQTPRFQSRDGRSWNHAPVRHNAHPADPKALPQTLDDRQPPRRVNRVPGHHLGAHRPVHADRHHLPQVAAVMAGKTSPPSCARKTPMPAGR